MRFLPVTEIGCVVCVARNHAEEIAGDFKTPCLFRKVQEIGNLAVYEINTEKPYYVLVVILRRLRHTYK